LSPSCFSFVFSVFFHPLAIFVGERTIRRQNLQCLLRILSRQILLPVRQIRIGKAVIHIRRIRKRADIQFQNRDIAPLLSPSCMCSYPMMFTRPSSHSFAFGSFLRAARQLVRRLLRAAWRIDHFQNRGRLPSADCIYRRAPRRFHKRLRIPVHNRSRQILVRGKNMHAMPAVRGTPETCCLDLWTGCRAISSIPPLPHHRLRRRVAPAFFSDALKNARAWRSALPESSTSDFTSGCRIARCIARFTPQLAPPAPATCGSTPCCDTR